MRSKASDSILQATTYILQPMHTVGIIGGKGLLGRFFKKFFERLGQRVLVSDVSTKLTNRELVKRCDIVLFSVPIHLTQKIIREVITETNPRQLLLDVTSLKTMPIEEMMKSRADVIGLHPMFRPGLDGFKNQTVAICVGRAKKENRDLIEKWLAAEGATVRIMTPREHDRLMSIIQVLIHFHTIALGHAMRKLNVSLKRTLRAASPIYQLEMDMVGRIFSQDPMLYGAIEMLNPETRKVIKTLIHEAERLASTILKKDMRAFEDDFLKTAKFLGGFKKQALEETDRLLPHIRPAEKI